MARLKQLLAWAKALSLSAWEHEDIKALIVGVSLILGVVLLVALCMNFLWIGAVIGILIFTAIMGALAYAVGCLITGNL